MAQRVDERAPTRTELEAYNKCLKLNDHVLSVCKPKDKNVNSEESMIEIIKPNLEQEHRNKVTDLKVFLVEEASDEEVNIELAIREKYSMSQELALHRKKLMGVVEPSEWDEYTAYVQECIDKVRGVEVEGA